MHIALGFHDISEQGEPLRPRMAGHTTLYTLTLSRFRAHLKAISTRAGGNRVRLIDPGAATPLPEAAILTFDDGAVSAYTCAAPELEALGWRGHFFVTTGWIGRQGFMKPSQIRELRERGHLIGTHSRTHPERFSALPWNTMVREWSDSRCKLEDIVGQPVMAASVPGGYYSHQVAHAAAAAGIRLLFTSEPTLSIATVESCVVVGRYSIRRNTWPDVTGSLAAGAPWPRRQQTAAWFAKGIVKRVAGPSYCAVRRFFFARTRP